LKTQNSSWEHQIRFNARWLWHHCRWTVPPPDKLFDAVNEVFQLYCPQKDSKTNLPLFNTQAWNDTKNVLKAIKLGLLSDPPGFQLYFQMYIEQKTNLPILRCHRGTNNPEGAIYIKTSKIECQSLGHQSDMPLLVSRTMSLFTILLLELSIAVGKCIRAITMLRF
jgi:hypothetical protein